MFIKPARKGCRSNRDAVALLKTLGGSLKGVAGIIVVEPLKNNRDGISFSFKGAGGEHLIAIFAVPKLDGFKLFLSPALFCDALSSAVKAARLGSAGSLLLLNSSFGNLCVCGLRHGFC